MVVITSEDSAWFPNIKGEKMLDLARGGFAMEELDLGGCFEFYLPLTGNLGVLD